MRVISNLKHCITDAFIATYLDKAVDKEKAVWPSSPQGLDKAVEKGPTTWTSRTSRPEQGPAKQDTQSRTRRRGQRNRQSLDWTVTT